MSLRDKPNSHKIIIPLVANLTINRAYDPSSGGIGGPGLDRTSLPESWINTPGVDPACNGDPDTDKYLALWLDTSDPATLVLAPEETDPDTGRKWQRKVLEWKDKSGKGRHAVAHTPETAPKLSKFQPFFPRSVDMSLLCLEPTDEGGGGGDPPPITCPEGVTQVRVCGAEVDAPCYLWNDPDPTNVATDWMALATGDWRTGAGTVVALTTYIGMQHSVADPAYEDGDLLGAVCPVAASRALPGFDAIDPGGPADFPAGIIFNGDPGKNGSVQVALAGQFLGWDTGSSELNVWFKDAGGTIDNSPSMAGRQIRIRHAFQQSGTGIMEPPVTLATGTVNSTGQLKICRCNYIGIGGWNGLGDSYPGDAMLIIDIAAPDADPLVWETNDGSGCEVGCGLSDIPSPSLKMNP